MNYKIYIKQLIIGLLSILVISPGAECLAQNKSKTEICKTNMKIAGKYLEIDPEMAVKYADSCLAMSDSSNISCGLCYYYLGSAYELMSNPRAAADNLEKALKLSKKSDDLTLKAKIFQKLGYVYCLTSNYDKALEYNLKSLKLFKDLDDSTGIADSYHYIAIVYYYLMNFDKALEYNTKAFGLRIKTKDSVGIAMSSNNIAMLMLRDSVDRALEFNESSLAIMESVGNDKNLVHLKVIANALINIGLIKQHLNEPEAAKEYLNRALKVNEKTYDLRSKALIFANLGSQYLTAGNNDKAYSYLSRGLEITAHIDADDLKAVFYNKLADYYISIDDYKNAYALRDKFNQIKDEVFTGAHRNKIQELEFAVEKELSDKKNEILRKEKKTQLVFFVIIFVLILSLGLVLYSRDRTKKKTNKILYAKNTELNEANAAKDKFFTIIAHDLKTPMWWQKNMTELLSQKVDNMSTDRIKEITGILDESAQHSIHLIDNLLQWSRTQTGRIEFLPILLDVNLKAKESIEHLNLDAKSKNVEIINNIENGAKIYADENMINIILRNLISNAVKFSNEGGKVEINYKRNNGFAEISVRDYGVGMAEEELDKLFRIDIHHTSLGTSQEKGTGLGLILCKEFIEMNKGSIHAISQIGEGTEFILSVPVSANAGEQ
ncbi:MAG: tetratricopeptide repeat-containing sensor histidine kinase [Candidatus Kapabacteria bacterium]|jgi:signal transduction histidine kinase|nr:tetratricopeptide repeat-containing sensor histidine kinase [Candidatus Kapabacteria bacterium]